MNAPFNPPRMDLAYAEVTGVGDPDGGFRVKVRVHGMAQAADQDFEMWARVAVPVAGADYGTALMPDVGDQVIVGFVAGDARHPIVLGSLFHGGAQPADDPVDGNAVKRWSLTGHRGTRVAVDESGSSKVTVETAGGVKVEVDDSGTKVTCTNGTSTVEIAPGGVSIDTPAKVEVQASQVEVTASMATVNAPMTTFNGIVKCSVLQTNTVIASVYTPGAGNVW